MVGSIRFAPSPLCGMPALPVTIDVARATDRENVAWRAFCGCRDLMTTRFWRLRGFAASGLRGFGASLLARCRRLKGAGDSKESRLKRDALKRRRV